MKPIHTFFFLPFLTACPIENNLQYIGPVQFGADCVPTAEPMLNDQPPVAICEMSNTTVRPIHEAIDFYGEQSYDPNGYDLVGYEWTLIKRPDGASNTFSENERRYHNIYGFVPDMAGEYVAELRVMNDRCVISDPCQATITARPNENLWVEMFWSHSGDDMDLHLVRNNGDYESDEDCYFGNCIGDEWHELDWGTYGSIQDDPFLDLDDIEGTGPENINIEQPANGRYLVAVHDYPGSEYNRSNDVTIRIHLNGELVYNQTKSIQGEDSYTEFATIQWPEGTVQPIE